MVKKANGEGSISRFKNGWRATITIGRDENGKLIRKQFYGKTKLETLNKANEYKNKYSSGILPSDEKITLKDWVRIWLYEYRINDLKPSSLSVYDGIYRNYIENSNLGNIKLKDLKSSNLQTFFNYLIRAENKDAGVLKNINKVLRPCLSQAVKEQYLPFNPCNGVTLPKVKAKKDIEVFTIDEQKHFIKFLENHRHKALIMLVLGTGLRIGEVLGLKWNDINFEDSTLTVSRTSKRVHIVNNKISENKTEILELEPKTKSSRRTIPIPSNVLKELKRHKKRQAEEKLKAGEIYVDNDLIFPNEMGEPTDTRNLTRSYERALKKAGIKYKNFHSLRHTYATRLFENDVPLKTVQVLMGHSNIKTTADIYTHVMPDEKIKAVEKLNTLFME